MNFSNTDDLGKLKSELEEAGVVFDKGLNDSELQKAEGKFKFKFPPDLIMFLKYALPIRMKGEVRKSFPNWRDLNDKYLIDRLIEPLGGIFFDIENNNFWLNSLGPKPTDLKEACKIMEAAFYRAPRLIPVWGHRYLPDRPSELNNPVLSVMQTDIIYYGANLYDYFQTEILKRPHLSSGESIKPIEFWKEIIDSY